MRFLAFEGGGTHTTAGLYDAAGTLLAEAEGAPSNPVAYGLEGASAALTELARELWPERETHVAALAGIAGAHDWPMRRALAERLCAALPLQWARVTEDLQPMLYANAPEGAAVLVIAGTGANVLGRAADGTTAQAGGRGTAFGDEGSAWQIGNTALRAAAYACDGLTGPTALVEALPAAAGVDTFNDLVLWAHGGGKDRVASLTRAVAQCAEQGDAAATQIVQEQARKLALYVRAVVNRLGLEYGTPVLTHGGLFAHYPFYRREFAEALDMYCALEAQEPPFRGHRAVLELRHFRECPDWLAEARPGETTPAAAPRTLDQLDANELVAVMREANAAAVATTDAPGLAALVARAAACVEAGGRLIYVGAGTSGRLAALDAAECPPTFGVAPGRVLALVAGGPDALTRSIEGAEDDTDAAVRDLAGRQPGPRDLVIGIAASGTTPYTCAAVAAARAAGAPTGFIYCNAGAQPEADVLVCLDTGAEPLDGSTRLKAGTATKCALNTISTGAFTLAGYVYRGRMVGVQPTNAKLRARAVGMVRALTGCDGTAAQTALDEAGGDVRVATLMRAQGVAAAAARERLLAAGGRLDRALDG